MASNRLKDTAGIVLCSYIFGHTVAYIFQGSFPNTLAIILSLVFGFYWSVLWGILVSKQDGNIRAGIAAGFSFATFVGWIAGFWDHWGWKVENLGRDMTTNQSLIVANGRMTIGLVGAPTNQNITVNINGRPEVLASGDVVEVAVNPSTTCHVRVQAFDMFKALITATCP